MDYYGVSERGVDGREASGGAGSVYGVVDCVVAVDDWAGDDSSGSLEDWAASG